MQMFNIKQLMMAALVGFVLAGGCSAFAQQDNRPPKEPRVVVQREKGEDKQRDSKKNSDNKNNENSDNKNNDQNRGKKP